MAAPLKVTEADVDILARTVYGEARGEKFDGMCAVAWTIVNRVLKQTWYGKTVREVCLKPWQYSCWHDQKDKMLAARETMPTFQRCKAAALLVLSGGWEDNTKGSTHYYADYIATPKWAIGHKPVAVFGVHKFFNDVK
jgi:N-acetylmuramoyl-L-alanine amidase